MRQFDQSLKNINPNHSEVFAKFLQFSDGSMLREDGGAEDQWAESGTHENLTSQPSRSKAVVQINSLIKL